MMETAETFQRYYDDDQYETKIAGLIEKAYRRLRNKNTTELKVWSEAVRIVKHDDRYLGVCLDCAKIRPPYDRLKLWGTGLLVVAVLVVLAFSLPNLELNMRGQKLGSAIWTAATTVTVAYAIVYLIRGKRWAAQFADRAIGKILNPLLPKKWR